MGACINKEQVRSTMMAAAPALIISLFPQKTA